MRERVREWAGALDDAGFARALLGLGLVPRRLHRDPTSALRALWKVLANAQDGVVAWRLVEPPADDDWRTYLPADQAARVVEAAFPLGTLRVALRKGSSLPTLDVWDFLRLHLQRDVALHLAGRAPKRRLRFRWPLRIGYLPGPETAPFADALAANDSWGGTVYRTVALSRRHPECDVLVTSAPSLEHARRAIERWSDDLDGALADIVVLFDVSHAMPQTPLAASTTWNPLAMDAVRATVAAGGIAVVPGASVDHADVVRTMCIQIAHANPFDVALSWATGGRALLLADRKLLQATRLRSKAQALARSLSSPLQAPLEIDPREFGRWGETAFEAALPSFAEALPILVSRPGDDGPYIEPAPRPAVDIAGARPTRGDVGTRLEERLDSLEWQRESDEASDLGRAMMALEEDDAARAVPRYLQAAFVAPDAPNVPLRGLLRPGTDYGVTVLIDVPRSDFLPVDAEFPPLPEPDDERAHELAVVFWEPRLSPTAQVAHIDLPPRGPSTSCTFKLRTSPRREAIDARITVLHRNRVLQTGRLTAPVGVEGAAQFRLDAIPRHMLNGLDERLQCSLALVLNDTEAGGAAHVIEKGRSTVLNVDDDAIQELVHVLGEAISRITENPSAYQGLRADGSVRLLRTLAQKGAILREYLTRHAIRSGRLDPPQLVQVVATKPGKIFPIEFIYQYRAPRAEADICPNAERALAVGDCLPTCPSRDPGPGAMATTICPLGFWGLRCAIERKAHTPDDTALSAPYVLRMEPARKDTLLRPLASTVVGATAKANLAVPTAVSDMMRRIATVVPRANLVTGWQDWVAAVANQAPTTLTLVVHQELDENRTPMIDIGSMPYLSSDLLEEEHVCAPNVQAPPLVLLIGCETGLAKTSYENFALRFHWRGAALVVSTVAEVLGRQAAPVAAEILESIHGVETRTSFAVVMRDLRRRLLADGTPMVLALTAYGDADWDVVR